MKSIFKRTFVIAGIMILPALVASAQTNSSSMAPQRYLMVAMGDSITAGALADTTLAWFNSVQQGPYDENLWTFLGSTFAISKYLPPFKITEAFETRYELSWSTGQWIGSHAQLLKQYLAANEPAATLSVINLAKSGGLAADVISQAQQIANLMASGAYTSLKYVTLLIGNNDACQGVADATTSQNLLRAFAILGQVKQTEPIRVLVSGLPRIPDLGEPEFMTAKTVLDFTCHAMRVDFLKECVALTNWSTTAEHDSLMQIIVAKNLALSQVVAQVNQAYPQIQAVFTNTLFGQSLGVADLAVDCFHPNADAQLRMSQALWNDQSWFH